MTRFDGWETQLYGDVMALPTKDELMHFRTKGSKNGVRRYQTESGEWTPLGLKERKAREGWGQSRAERKAVKQAKKAEREAARAEKRSKRAAAKAAARNAFNEKRRKNDLSKLTDEELKKKLERAKMEQEYREITRSPLLKTGEALVSKYLENKAIKEERKYQTKKDAVQYARDMLKLKEQTKQKQIDAESAKERAEADKARASADKARAETDRVDIEKGTRAMTLKNQKKNLKLQAKRYVSDFTIRGGLRKKYNAISTARGEGRAERIKERAFVSGILRGSKRIDKHNSKLDPWDPNRIAYDPNAWDRDKNRRKGGNDQKKKKGEGKG